MARAISRTRTAKQSASQRPTPRPMLLMKTAEYPTAAASRRTNEMCTRNSTPKNLPKGNEDRNIDFDCRRTAIRDLGTGIRLRRHACDCWGISVASFRDAAWDG